MARTQFTAAVPAAIVIAFTVAGCGGNGMTTAGPGTGPPADTAPSFSAMAGAAQTWTDEGAVSLSIPAATGGDGALSYVAAGLPAGILFDPASRTLSGTPEEVGSGTITITVTDTDADGDHDTDTYTIAWVVRPGSLVLGSGLHPSDAPPVYAETASSNLARLVADGANSFSPLSAAITRDWDAGSTTVSSAGPHIKDIRGDGANGFHVTFVAEDGEEVAVHFTAADLEDQWTYAVTDDAGDQYWLWTYTGDRSTGRSGFRYLEVDGASGVGSQRFWFVFGARTPQSALPEGSAVYSGRFRGDSFRADNPSTELRQRLYGEMRIVANFDLGTLEGDVRSIQGTEPGAPSSSRTSWPTSSFTITDGRIVNGQFTATITGHDSDSSVSLAESVAGYVGSLLGELYGPGAEEIGAVFTATRDADEDEHDRVLQGHLAGQRSLGAYSDTEPFSTGVDRHDYSTSPRIVSQDANNRVTSIAADDEGGYTITYLVDGESRTVSFEQADFGTTFPNAYYRRDGVAGYYFDVIDEGYSYVRLGYWSYGRYSDDESSAPEFATLGTVVHGLRTKPDEMPASGGATYSGDIWADSWASRPENASLNAQTRYRGALSLTADFAAGSIAGEIDELVRRAPGETDYSATSGRFVIDNGSISGNELSGDLSGLGYSGTVDGSFYGPAAAEVGGVMRATDANSNMLHGIFRGRQE